MSKTKTKKVRLLFGSLILLLAVLLVSSTLLFLNYLDKESGLFPVHEETFGADIKVDGVEYTLNDNVQSLLVLGLDKFENTVDETGYYNEQQADFIMLFVLDNENKTYSALHINRDTMAEINVLGVAGEKIDTFEGQIALAHAFGNGREVSCRNTADAVSGLLNNIDIERYVSVTMDAVPVITELVGGVEVEVKDDFSGIDESLVMGETVTLTKDNALTFVRSRQGLDDSTNANRMSRQQEFLSSFFDAFGEKAKSDDNFIVDASLKLSEYMVSNYTANQLENLIENLDNYEFSGIYEIDGELKVGEEFLEFYADEKSIDKLVLDLFYVRK